MEKVQVLMGDGVLSEKPTAHLVGDERYTDRKFTRQARAEDPDLGASVQFLRLRLRLRSLRRCREKACGKRWRTHSPKELGEAVKSSKRPRSGCMGGGRTRRT